MQESRQCSHSIYNVMWHPVELYLNSTLVVRSRDFVCGRFFFFIYPDDASENHCGI